MLFRRLSLVFAGIAVAVCSFVGRADEVGVNLLPVDSVTRKILTDVEVMAFLPGDSALVALGPAEADLHNRCLRPAAADKSVNYYVNALGRTESWSNTIPRYLMVRVRYHLDLSPK